jgi:hypothetical protein
VVPMLARIANAEPPPASAIAVSSGFFAPGAARPPWPVFGAISNGLDQQVVVDAALDELWLLN